MQFDKHQVIIWVVKVIAFYVKSDKPSTNASTDGAGEEHGTGGGAMSSSTSYLINFSN
jgi:hypothetical protein